jgi:hypothetical protein
MAYLMNKAKHCWFRDQKQEEFLGLPEKLVILTINLVSVDVFVALRSYSHIGP